MTSIEAWFSQIGVEVWANDEPIGRFSQIGVEVWARIPRVRDNFVWPFRLVPPAVQRTYRVGNVRAGPLAMDGNQQQISRTDGGGLWRTDCVFRPQSHDQIRALRAWDGYLDGGVQEFVMPVIDLAFAPRDFVGNRLRRPTPHATASDYFGEVASYNPSPIVLAELYADVALRDTSCKIQIIQGQPLKGGEHFSLFHDNYGWRLYRVSRVRLVESGNICTVDIRPPMREATTVGSGAPVAEFDIPRCTMRLHPDSVNSLNVGITNFRVGGDIQVSFIESLEKV